MKHFHTCPRCHRDDVCELGCDAFDSLDDGRMRGGFVVCTNCPDPPRDKSWLCPLCGVDSRADDHAPSCPMRAVIASVVDGLPARLAECIADRDAQRARAEKAERKAELNQAAVFGELMDERDRERARAEKAERELSAFGDRLQVIVDGISCPKPTMGAEQLLVTLEREIERLKACPTCEETEALADADRAEIDALRAAAQALIAALPKCDECTRPATRAWRRGGERLCDEHGHVAPEYPRAAPLRALEALIEKGGDRG